MTSFHRVGLESFMIITELNSSKTVKVCVCKGFTLKVEADEFIVDEPRPQPFDYQLFRSDLSHSRCDLEIFDDGTGIGIGDIRDAARYYRKIEFDLAECGLSVSLVPNSTYMMLGFENNCPIGSTPRTKKR